MQVLQLKLFIKRSQIKVLCLCFHTLVYNSENSVDANCSTSGIKALVNFNCLLKLCIMAADPTDDPVDKRVISMVKTEINNI